MEQERFVVIDNKKGVLIPLPTEKQEIEKTTTEALEEKVSKLHILIKALIKQTIKDTIKEYSLQLTEELKEYEKVDVKRWDELQRKEEENWKEIRRYEKERWDLLEKREREYREKIRKEDEKRWKEMETHFENVDKTIREKQMGNKNNCTESKRPGLIGKFRLHN